MPSLSIRIDRAAYPGTPPVLNDIADAGFVAIIGRNGSGKSTLLSCIAGLIPFVGTVSLAGTPLHTLSPGARAARIAMVQQSPRAPHITVETLVSFGRRPYLSLANVRETENDRRAVEAAITAASLDGIRRRHLDCISGGELRRAYLGMALAQETPILLLDEATANMDMDYEASFLALLRDLAHTKTHGSGSGGNGSDSAGGKTVLSVMHNLGAAVRYADRIVVVDGKTVCFVGTPAQFCDSGLAQQVFRAAPVQTEHGIFFAPIPENAP